MFKVTVHDGLLSIYTGSGYYDLNETYDATKIFELVQEVGVRGGHIGWQLKSKSNKYESIGQDYETFDFGRKYCHVMEEVKKLIKSGKINAKITVLKDRPTKCY